MILRMGGLNVTRHDFFYLLSSSPEDADFLVVFSLSYRFSEFKERSA